LKVRLLIHDLDEKDERQLKYAVPESVILFSAKPRVKPCVGCFGCWIKTPGRCVIKDRCWDSPAMMAAGRELILVSRNVYGGFSPEVKAVLDRSIGYMMPFFRYVGSEMHHTARYDNPLTLTAHFYGEGISEGERGIARRLVKANAVNLGAEGCQVCFHDSLPHLKEALL